jgi:hypothetical protein
MISSTQVVHQNTPALEQRVAEAIQVGLIAAAKVYAEQFDARVQAAVDARCSQQDIAIDAQALRLIAAERGLAEVKTSVQAIDAHPSSVLPAPVIIQVPTAKKLPLGQRIKIWFTGE